MEYFPKIVVAEDEVQEIVQKTIIPVLTAEEEEKEFEKKQSKISITTVVDFDDEDWN